MIGWLRRVGTRAAAPERDERRANRGPRARRRRVTWDQIVALIAIAAATVAVVKASGESSHAVDVASSTDRRLERNERNDRDDLRAAAYRLCVRNKVDRAFAHSRIAGALRGRARERALRDLERLDGLPILDCTPNLQGRGARPLPPAQQRAYVRAWEQHKLPAPALGICPSSKVPGRIQSPERCNG